MTDHAPIDLVIAFGVSQERSKGWQMNSSILQNEESCQNQTAEQVNVLDAFKADIERFDTALI